MIWMMTTRRDFAKLAAAALGTAAAAPKSLLAQAKPNSKFGGVQVGVISYSYRQMPGVNIPKILDWMVENGINACELENYQEEWAGGPTNPIYKMLSTPMPPTADVNAFRARMNTPEFKAQMAQYKKDLTAFRTKVPMSKYAELKSMYAAKGVSIYAFKASITMDMADAEADSIFNAAKACGANQVTMEMPDGQPMLTKKIGEYALKHKMMVGYHAHLQATPTTWDEAMAQSPYNGINLDLGHFTAAGNGPDAALAFLKQNHAKITSMHMKDRKTKEHGEANMPWGEGDTPITQALQLMKAEHYTFPATIELEYKLPKGSNAVKEVGKCLAYAKKALV